LSTSLRVPESGPNHSQHARLGEDEWVNREAGAATNYFLRRTVDPYVGITVICALVTAFMLWVSYRTSQANMLIAVLFIWSLVAFNVWFGSRYRVWHDDQAVFLRSAGWGGEISIPFEEILKISENTATAGEMVQGNHPFRRVIVFGRRSTQPIYISTKHFAEEDVNRLVEAVVDRCPNVVLDKRVSRRIGSDRSPPPKVG
jgi:hypothetical protein